MSLELGNQQWDFRYSPGMPSHPTPAADGGWTFDFPVNSPGMCPDPNFRAYQNGTATSRCKAVHYLTTNHGSIASYASLSALVSITGSAPVFDHNVEATEDGAPPNFRFFMEHTNDSTLVNPEFRWWSHTFEANGVTVPNWPLALADNVVFSVSLTDLTKWSNVNGTFAADDAAGFNAAKANLQRIGFTFGGGFNYGHGVMLDSGSARFRLQSFMVN